MAELTPNSRGNGYEHSNTSKNEEVIISVPQQASSRASHFSRHYCIQKVPDFLRGEEHNTRDYDPAVVSFGPYHHGKAKLKLAEDFKPKALELFVAESGKDADFYYYKVAEVIHDVRRCYLENSTGEYDDAVFARMMLLDACVIINHIWMILEFSRLSEATINPHEVIENTINEVEMFKATIDHLGLLVFRFFHRDMFLLENQIPLWLLKRLINLKYGKDRGKEMLNKFFSIFGGEYMQPRESKTEIEPPHLLAAFRRILVADWKKGVETRSGWSVFECFPKREKLKPVRNTKKYFRSFSSVTDLKAKGIHFSRSSTASLTDINFKSSYFHGQLQLPTWYVSIHTKAIFRNLVAFEMCPNTFIDPKMSTCINFMKLLIESAKDVKELRENGIIINNLGSDEEVMQLFKDINIFGVKNNGMFFEIKEKIQEHYNNKAKTWVAEFIHTYFRSPWSAIALLAAGFLLCLNFLQTYFTIHSPKR